MGALFVLGFIFFGVGVLYPIGGIAYYKLVKHSTKTIKEIIDEL